MWAHTGGVRLHEGVGWGEVGEGPRSGWLCPPTTGLCLFSGLEEPNRQLWAPSSMHGGPGRAGRHRGSRDVCLLASPAALTLSPEPWHQLCQARRERHFTRTTSGLPMEDRIAVTEHPSTCASSPSASRSPNSYKVDIINVIGQGPRRWGRLLGWDSDSNPLRLPSPCPSSCIRQ